MEKIEVVAGIIWHNSKDEILLSKRLKEQHQGGLWEFPGGKIEAGESHEQALQRELMEELSISAEHMQHFHSVEHQYKDKHVSLHFYHCRGISGEIHANQGQQWRWFERGQLVELEFPAANKVVVEKLIDQP